MDIHRRGLWTKNKVRSELLKSHIRHFEISDDFEALFDDNGQNTLKPFWLHTQLIQTPNKLGPKSGKVFSKVVVTRNEKIVL